MVRAVVGANWGDEGKGKITDMLGETSDIIVRFQGGSNAGHTIVNNYGKFVAAILRFIFGGWILWISDIVNTAMNGCNVKICRCVQC